MSVVLFFLVCITYYTLYYHVFQFYYYIGLLSPLDVGAQTIAQQMQSFSYMIPYGIGTAGNIRIGQFLGSNNAEEAKNLSKITISICGRL